MLPSASDSVTDVDEVAGGVCVVDADVSVSKKRKVAVFVTQ